MPAKKCHLEFVTDGTFYEQIRCNNGRAKASGTRLSLPLNLMSALALATPLTKPREASLDLPAHYNFENSDTTTY